MTIIVQDSFERENSTTLGNTETGQAWQKYGTAVFGILNGQAYPSTSANDSWSYVDALSNNVKISVNLVSNFGESGIYFRVVNGTNYIRMIRVGGTLYLQRRLNGASATLATKAVPYTVNEKQTVISKSDGTIEVYINDALQITTTSANHLESTQHGFGYGAHSASARWDNFVIESLDTGGGEEEPTGTDGSITLGLTQQIYSDSSVNLSLSQQIYADISANLNLIQNIYRDTETLLGLNQTIYSDGQAILDLIQEFYEDSQTYITLQLIQQIYKDSSADLPLTQAIFHDSEIDLPLRQEMYEEKEANLSLTQNVYKDDSAVLNLSQSIYKDYFLTLNTVQQMYQDGEISLPLLIQIRDDLVNLIGVIRLIGKRVLNVPLQGKRELNVTLKGGIDVTAINQNFTMYAGDSKNIVVTMPEDLTGCTVKWGLRQRMYSTENLLSKTTSNGISINGSEISIKLAPEDTQTLSGTYYHECEVTDQLNNVSTIFTGMVTISKSAI
jgi:hypothetical protein